MNRHDLKETMEQICIPEEMQEQIILNIQNRISTEKVKAGKIKTGKIKNGKTTSANWKKPAAVAAAFVLAMGIVSIPVQALVQNIVRVRMESIPKEELQNMADMMRGQEVEADSFSREYSDTESRRWKELRQLYQEGIFPENIIPQVDTKDEVIEGTLCYIKNISFFNLPDRELTDEEILEIIDFNHTRSYAIEQSPAGQEARKEYQEEQNRFRKQILDTGGISEEEAVEIAKNYMKDEFGISVEGKFEIQTALWDISKADNDHKGDVAYRIAFRDLKDCSTYLCIIDSGNGKILKVWKPKTH